jgi:hypothetical protein
MMRKFIFLILFFFAFSVFAEDARMQQLEDDYTNLTAFVMELSEKVDDLQRKVNQKTTAVLLEESIQISQPQQIISNEKWKNKAAWNSLNNGMTINEIVGVLGNPTESKVNSTYDRTFIYTDGKIKGKVDFWNGKINKTTPPSF